MKFTKKFAACLTALLFVLATAAVFAAEGTTDWGNGVIRVTGSGGGKAKYKNNPGQYRLTAQQAARMDAQRKLAEYVSGVQVTANSSMHDLALEDDRVDTMLKSVVLKNAIDVGAPQFFDDGVCTITMELHLYGGNNSVAAAAFIPFKDDPKVDFPKPVNATVVDQSYTGLVIDCRGMNINPVMSPVIKNADGTKIYGHQNLDYDRIIVKAWRLTLPTLTTKSVNNAPAPIRWLSKPCASTTSTRTPSSPLPTRTKFLPPTVKANSLTTVRSSSSDNSEVSA